MIASFAGAKYVTALLFTAAVVFFVNGLFGWLTRIWHVGDDWGWWAHGNDDWPLWFRILWDIRTETAIIFVYVVVLLLVLFNTALSA